MVLKPLNAELNLICHLPALLGAHHILHVSRTRVNMLFNPFVTSGIYTYRYVCVYTYICMCVYIYIYIPPTKGLFKSAGITVSHFFSMLLSTLRQTCTNDTACSAAVQTLCKWDIYIYIAMVTKGLKMLFVSTLRFYETSPNCRCTQASR